MSDRVVVMNRGVVQQVGTPLEVYNLPRNEFVAGFLGSPAMNFIPCELRQEADTLTAQAGQFLWSIPLGGEGGLTRLLANRQRLHGKATLGVRPEDIAIRATAQGPTTGIPCRVTLVEHMGAQNAFILQIGGQQVTVTTSADFYLPSGSSATLHLNNAKLHFFDANSGQNLTL